MPNDWGVSVKERYLFDKLLELVTQQDIRADKIGKNA